MPAPVLIENSTCRANLTELSGGGCRASLADRPMRHHIQYAANLFKYAPWLTRKCLLRWGSLCAFATIGVLALNLALHSGAGLTDAAGERFGRDFFQFWSSAVLAAAGRPEAAYIVGPHQTVDQPLAYPPIVMLLCGPLAGLSYAHAVVLWGCLGLALFTWSLSRLVGWEMAAFAAVGTPAAFINIFLAQNGCYTSVLLVWGLTLVERCPVGSFIWDSCAASRSSESCWSPP
ncbi:MAG: glycosyltransferase 87 family protein [Stellaceae bacterium]